MIKQHPLTIVARVIPEKLPKLNEILERVRKSLDNGSPAIFEATGTIHYGRILLLKPEYNAKPKDTSLVFSTDYDGNEKEHLSDLSSKLGDLIDELFECCEGYPSIAERNNFSRRQYLADHKEKVDSFYVGAPGRTLQQVRQESKLRDHLWNLLNDPKWKDKSAKEVHQSLQQKVLKDPEFSWATQSVFIPKNLIVYYIIGAAILLSIIGYLDMQVLKTIFLVVGAVAIFVIGWILSLHFIFEVNEKPLGLTPSQISEPHLKELEEYEDFHNQNQFSQLIPMRMAKMRVWTYQALMIYAIIKIHLEFEEGKLMGIPTIHFARWLRVQNKEQCLFFSNFDGSWQQYLGDFIDKSGWGLTGIFSNTENFPVTRYLFWGGAYDEEHFLAWSRYYQIPTQVWYCAYPKLSIKNVNNNSAIRQGIRRNLNENQAQLFLKRF